MSGNLLLNSANCRFYTRPNRSLWPRYQNFWKRSFYYCAPCSLEYGKQNLPLKQVRFFTRYLPIELAQKRCWLAFLKILCQDCQECQKCQIGKKNQRSQKSQNGKKAKKSQKWQKKREKSQIAKIAKTSKNAKNVTIAKIARIAGIAKISEIAKIAEIAIIAEAEKVIFSKRSKIGSFLKK